jgi:hypothetical protein
MQDLYIREAYLTVGEKRFATRISFEIKKNNESDPNKAKISIYNLSSDSRAFLESTTDKMQLVAGYQGNSGIIFWGNIANEGIKHERKGGDIITTMQCGDGLVEIQDAHIDFTWGPGSSCRQIVNQALSTLGLALSSVNGDMSKQYLQGKSYSGTVKKLLDQITDYCDLTWNTQNNAVQIYPKGKNALTESILLNSETGLIGLPSKTKDGILTRSLLNYRLIPGGLFTLETKDGAKTGSGTYNIITVKHYGDTSEGEYYTEAEGKINA